MIRIGVLGAARVVPYGLLAPAKETQGVEVTGIASRVRATADRFAARHGVPRAFDSYDALLAANDIDAVYIALPPALHYDWARRAIEAGKHVLCEKPLAENADRAEGLASIAELHGRVLMEAMHVRYMERLRRQRELVLGGELGCLVRIESYFRTPYTPMAKHDFRLSFDLGGGAALDLGCYAVSCLRFMAGEEPEVLSACAKCASPQVDRWMRADLRFPSGIAGVAEFGFRGLYMPRGGIEVTGENGSIKWDGKGLVIEKGGNVVREAVPASPTYRLQLEAFAHRVRGEESDAPSLKDAVATARVVDSIYRHAGLSVRGASGSS